MLHTAQHRRRQCEPQRDGSRAHPRQLAINGWLAVGSESQGDTIGVACHRFCLSLVHGLSIGKIIGG